MLEAVPRGCTQVQGHEELGVEGPERFLKPGPRGGVRIDSMLLQG